MENAQELESVDQETQTASLDDDIIEALEASEAGEAPAEAENPVIDDAEAEAQDDSEAEPVPAEEEDDSPASDLLEPQSHWKTEYREAFSGMTRAQQDQWVQREKDFEQGIQAKSAELREVRESLQDVQSIVAPYVHAWSMQGLTPTAGLTQALATMKAIQDDPASFIMDLASNKGVNLEQQLKEAPYEDPAVRELRQQVTGLTEQLNQAQQSSTQQEQQRVIDAVNAFETDTDESGNLKHPHFRAVSDAMGILLKTGRAQTLSQAYEYAVQFDPNIQSEMQSQREKATIVERQSAANKAKKAARVVESSDPSTVGVEKTLEEEILSQLEAAGM